ncbi:maleylpyruvate isomerase N-terminal domain-containing protein [Nonomuraea sp. NPDC052634]|uniref:maleylpyruvate isomerase N-terminal domain-containing protein n=1 Tax=Nonomuraea sp. NPDC052634 TaxID=3155813 RepID=UPI003441AB6C
MSEHEKALKAGVALLERATTYALGSLRLVTPAILRRPTPCTGWTLHDLLLHLSDSLQTLAEAATPVCTNAGGTASAAERAVVSLASPMDGAEGSGMQRQVTKRAKPTVIAAPRAAPQHDLRSSAPQRESRDAAAQQDRPTPAPQDGLGMPALQRESRDAAAQQARPTPAPQDGLRTRAPQDGLGTSAPQRESRDAAAQQDRPTPTLQDGLRDPAAQDRLRDPALRHELHNLPPQHEQCNPTPQDELCTPAPQDGPGNSTGHPGLRNPALLLRDSATEVLGRWVALAGDDLVAVGDRHLTRPMVAAVGAIEVAVHGWDVAMACGERRPLPPLLAEELLDLARLFVTAEERFVRFAPPLAVPPHAPAHDHLLAYLGRDPAWTPFR